MSHSRIYQSSPLHVDASLRLDEKASHHLARVLRAKIDDKLTVFNGQGGEYEAVITRIDKKGMDVNLLSFNARDVESPIEIYLAQSMARGEKMDFIIQKAVELGVNKIIPLISERCNVKLEGERGEKRVQHWQSVIVSACEQSGRNRLPDIVAPVNLKTWLTSVKDCHCFVLSPHVTDKLSLTALCPDKPLLLLIGPEGGFSDNEVESALQQGFHPLNLGPRVLRTETAALAAIATLQYCYGDFSQQTL